MRYPAILAAAVLGAATVFAVPAAAETAESVSVKYSDLDLSTSEGQARLERRITSAARTVCGMDEVTVGTRLASREAQRCFAQTKSTMHEQVAAMVARDGSRGG